MADMSERLAPEKIADYRRRYVETKEPVRSIAKSARMSMDQFYALREQQGWPLRRPPDKTFERALRRLPPPPPPPRTPGDGSGSGEAPRADAPPDPAEPADPAETVARAKRLAHDIVADLQRERLRRPRAFAPRAARELAAVARVLEQVRRIEEALHAQAQALQAQALQAQTLQAQDSDHDAQDPGRSLVELRDELHRRLVEARRDQGGGDGVSRDAEPG
jgi:hypothetical protein